MSTNPYDLIQAFDGDVQEPQHRVDTEASAHRMKLLEILYQYDATIKTVSTTHADEYTVDIYAKGFTNSISGAPLSVTHPDLKAHALNVKDWFIVGDHVKVHLLPDQSCWIIHQTQPEIWLIRATGPSGEAATTNNSYWISRAFLSKITAPYKWTEYGSTPHRKIVAATNLAETAAATHTLTVGTPVAPWFTYDYSAPGNRLYWFQAASGFSLNWGVVASVWVPGTNAVTITPCVGPVDSTPTGSNISCGIHPPYSRPAVAFGAVVGDIVPYTTSGINALFNPPVLPRPTLRYQGIFNNSSDAAAPQYISDYVRAHV